MTNTATASTHLSSEPPHPGGSELRVSEVTCPECSQQNPLSRKFCGGCGLSLWKKCPQCGAEHIEGETFCGGCGANLQQMYTQETHRLQASLDEASRLASQYEFDQAIRRLRDIAAMKDRRYRQYADLATRAIQRVQAQKEQAMSAADESLNHARQLLPTHDYHQAVGALEEIPGPLRDEGAEQLLKDTRAKRDAVVTLNAEIREAVRSNDMQGLSARLERLLDLTPGDEQARRLSHQMRDRLFRAASKKIQEDDYRAAIRILDDIPTCELDDQVSKLAEQTRELDWLMTNLRLAAVVDDTLLALAERLLRLRPQNQEAARLYKKLKSRLAAGPSNAVQAAPDWAVPRNPHLGCTVDWSAGLRRIRCSEDASKAFRDKPGCYFVACGLAIQGLESASITMNLLASDRQPGVLDKWRLRRKRAPQAAWGLDLGTHALKAVRMLRTDDGEPLVVDSCQWIEHAGWSRTEDDKVICTQVWRKSLEQFLAQHAVDGEKVCISLSGSLVLGRFFDVPRVEEKHIDSMVRHEAAGQLPFALEDLHWGYQAFELGNQQAAESQKWRIALQAVRSHHVQDLIRLCAEVGIKPDVIQSDCVALHNLVAYEYFDENTPQDGAVAMLDVGAGNSNLVISTPQSTWFRSIGVAGEAFTSKLARSFQLTRDQAEALKCCPSRAKRLSPVYEVLDPALAHLVDEVQRSLKVYTKRHPDVPVRCIHGAGGGFAMHGLLRRLRTGR